MRITFFLNTIFLGLIFILILCSNGLYGQIRELRFSHLNSEDGLSDNHVNCFIQDQRGFIWIGTNNGLNRYDGHEFLSFNTESAGKTKICGNTISALDIDNNGHIWIGTEDNGFCSLDPLSLEFETPMVQKGDSLSYKRINDILAINENLIGLGIQSGYMAKYHIEEDSLRNIYKNKIGAVYQFNRINEFEFASVGINGGLRFENGEHLKILIDSTNQKTYSLNSIHVDSLKIWAGSWGNTLCEYDRENNTWKYHTLEKEGSENKSNTISEILSLNSNQLIIGTDNNGLFIFDKPKNSCFPLAKNENRKFAAKGLSIRSMFKDKSSRIWIGSNAGIDVYDPLLNQFEITFLPQLDGAKIYDIIKLDQNLFFASTKGLLKIETLNQEINESEIIGRGQKFRSFAKSEEGQVFVGTNKGLFKLSEDPFRLNTLPELKMNTLTYASTENMIGSTFSDLFFYKQKNETWFCAMAYGLDLLLINLSENEAYGFLPASEKDSVITADHLIRSFYTDSKNKLWACSRNKGLIRIDQVFSKDSLNERIYDSKGGKKGLKSYFFSEKDGMPSRNVFDIVEDPDGTYWISTTGHGLINFNPKSDNQFQVLDIEHKTIHGLEIDKNGNLWGVTSKGILYYNPKENKHKLFNQIDGISLDGMVGYWYKDEEGVLYKGLNGGYIKFQPEEIEFNQEINPVYLTHININNSPNDSLIERQNLELAYDENFITFQFASPNFTNSKLNSYEYILESVDPEWRTIQGKNEAVYTSLQAGEYAFKIRSANNDGMWGEYQTLSAIHISPPWWQTRWFYSLVLLAIISILFGLYKYRIAQLVKFYEMRNQIARDLHDDIGSTLGSISFYSEVAEQQLKKHGLNPAENVVQKIGSTSREMMDSIGDIVWAVNPSNDTIEKIIDRMKNFAVPLLSSKEISSNFNIDQNLLKEKLGMEKRKNMFLIFKEGIHNSLKYANCQSVSIHLFKEGKDLILNISDDGLGFDPENITAYNGNGMVNIRARAKEMNALVNISSELNKGTSILLKFEMD